MNSTSNAVAKTSTLTSFRSVPALSEAIEPSKVLEFAHKAAKALKQVIDSKPKKTIVAGEQYLLFEDWQTIARFYNVTVGTDWTKPIITNGKSFGFEAKAVAYKDGVVISSAEASCFRDEKVWADKPAFQIKSMAQTRAAAKCLRNVFAWVIILAGYKATPYEEMCDDNDDIFQPIKTDVVSSKTFIQNSRSWENRSDSNDDRITEKQITLLRSLILEKIIDDDQREQELQSLQDLDKSEASSKIHSLINLIC